MTNLELSFGMLNAEPSKAQGETPQIPQTPSHSWELAGVGLLALVWLGAPLILGGTVLLQLEPLGELLKLNLFFGWVIYITAFSLGAGLGLVPTYAMAVLGGWVFGPISGAAGALLGCSAASALGYSVSRWVSRTSILGLLSLSAKAQALYRDLLLSGTARCTLLVAVLRLPPQCPFALTNLVMGAAAVPVRAFLVGTFVGMLPRTLLGALVAAAAASTGAKSLQDFLSSGPGWPAFAWGLAAMVIALGTVGWLGNSALKRLRKSYSLKATS